MMGDVIGASGVVRSGIRDPAEHMEPIVGGNDAAVHEDHP